MMISRLLAGYLLGAITTQAFAYFTRTSETYVAIQKKLGKTVDKDSAYRVRDFLFACLSIAYSLGYILGPGKMS